MARRPRCRTIIAKRTRWSCRSQQAHQWLIHGTADDVVPPAFSRDYVALKQRRSAMQQEDAHLLEIPSADHFDLIDPHRKAWNSVEQIVLDATA